LRPELTFETVFPSPSFFPSLLSSLSGPPGFNEKCLTFFPPGVHLWSMRAPAVRRGPCLLFFISSLLQRRVSFYPSDKMFFRSVFLLGEIPRTDQVLQALLGLPLFCEDARNFLPFSLWFSYFYSWQCFFFYRFPNARGVIEQIVSPPFFFFRGAADEKPVLRPVCADPLLFPYSPAVFFFSPPQLEDTSPLSVRELIPPPASFSSCRFGSRTVWNGAPPMGQNLLIFPSTVLAVVQIDRPLFFPSPRFRLRPTEILKFLFRWGRSGSLTTFFPSGPPLRVVLFFF